MTIVGGLPDEVVSPDGTFFLFAAGVANRKFEDGDARPPRGEEKMRLASGGEVPVQWTATPHHYGRTKWRLYGVNKTLEGDGTVPKCRRPRRSAESWPWIADLPGNWIRLTKQIKATGLA